jgi:hypothetical protein
LVRMVLSLLYLFLPSDRNVDSLWGVLIRRNYSGWAALQVLLMELTNGDKYLAMGNWLGRFAWDSRVTMPEFTKPEVELPWC